MDGVVYHRLKFMLNWHDRFEQNVWGLTHDLHEDTIDLDERVNVQVQDRAWDRLHEADDPTVLFSTLV